MPGDLATPTGGYAYDRRMIAELRELGWQVDVLGLGDGFPRPERSDAQGRATKLLAELPKPVVPSSSMAWPSACCPRRGAALRERNPLIALVHHPLALETGLPPERGRSAARAASARRLRMSRRVIVTSPSTARCSLPNTACRPTASPSPARAPIRAPLARGSRDGVVRLLVRRRRRAAQGL